MLYDIQLNWPIINSYMFLTLPLKVHRHWDNAKSILSLQKPLTLSIYVMFLVNSLTHFIGPYTHVIDVRGGSCYFDIL